MGIPALPKKRGYGRGTAQGSGTAGRFPPLGVGVRMCATAWVELWLELGYNHDKLTYPLVN